MGDDSQPTSTESAARRQMDLEHIAQGRLEEAAFGAAYKHGRHGRASAKITDRRTKVHECDVSMQVDLLEGTLLAEKHSPEGELLSGTTNDLFLGYE